MRNVYISFLGTSPYVACTYRHPERGAVENVRYVQEATLSMFCRDWTPDDRIFIFTTELAYEKNWLDGGNGKDSETESGEGLKTRIEKLALKAPVERIPIADMTSETEMWEIFQKMFDVLAPEDRVVFDITHAFRSIPMLAIVVLNYARVLKKIQLGGIYYGAFEALRHKSVDEEITPEERVAPVFDLTGFNTLLEWSAAIDGFLKSGDARQLRDLAHQSLRPILRDNVEMRDSGNALKRLSENLEAFGQILSTCRGKSITKITQNIQQNLSQCAGGELIPAFHPLLKHIGPRLERFNGDNILDGFQASRWCMEHNLVQQGYTILQETLVTHFLQVVNLATTGDDRLLVTAAATILRKGTPREKWRSPAADNIDSTEKLIVAIEESGLVSIINEITKDRNDLNHAGQNENPQAAKKFYDKLEGYLNDVESHLFEQNFIKSDSVPA